MEDFMTCSVSSGYCGSSDLVCCVAPSDSQAGKTTCRPPTDCADASAVFGCESYYTVMPGDTCDGVSATTGRSVDAILALNPAVRSDCSDLQAGQTLCIMPDPPASLTMEPSSPHVAPPASAWSRQPSTEPSQSATPSEPPSAGVPDWSTCHPSRDTCAGYGSVCCVAAADQLSDKHTCRPAAAGTHSYTL